MSGICWGNGDLAHAVTYHQGLNWVCLHVRTERHVSSNWLSSDSSDDQTDQPEQTVFVDRYNEIIRCMFSVKLVHCDSGVIVWHLSSRVLHEQRSV